MSAIDLFPTICALTGAKVPSDAHLDGADDSAIWLGKPSTKRAPLFWEYGRNDQWFKFGPDRSPNVAVRRDNWKLLVNANGSDAQLYDLTDDMKEAKNLAAEKPAVAAELKKLALEWRASLPKKTN
jgi:arylsulfatase A-like enzyme